MSYIIVNIAVLRWWFLNCIYAVSTHLYIILNSVMSVVFCIMAISLRVACWPVNRQTILAANSFL